MATFYTDTGSFNKAEILGILSVSGSLILTGSLLLNGGNIQGTASWANNAVSASYATNASTATTASYVLNATSASYATNASIATTASYVLNAVSASYATNASIATTASYVLNAVSSSYALTASYALNGGGGSGSGNAFPYNGNAIISGSLLVSGSSNTVKIQGSGSNIFVISGSQGEIFNISEDASDANLFKLTSGSIDIFVVKDPKVVAVSGSLIVTGSIIGSLQGTASYAVTASYAMNGGGSGNAFPYNGNAVISGSLTVSGSGANNPIIKLQGSGSNIFVVSGSTGGLLQIGDSSGTELFAVSSASIDILTINSNKKIIVSGSILSTEGMSGSFSGSFFGNGSGLTNITATAAPAGQNQSIQFNDAGATSGSGNFTFNKSTNTVNLVGTLNGSITTDQMILGAITVTPSTNQNDYSPTGWNDTDPNKAAYIQISGSASIKITGLTGGVAGRIVNIINTSPNRLIILEDNSSSSTAANRFDFRNPVFLLPNGGNVTLIYDGINSRWRAIASSSGIGYGAFFNEFDDFIGGATSMTTTAIEIGRFSGIAAGTGASGQAGTYLVNTTEKPYGVYQIDTGTTATGRAIVGSSSATSIVIGQGQAIMLTRLASEQLLPGPSGSIWAGWIDAVGATKITNGVYWQYQTGSALTSSAWQGMVSSASISSSLNTILGPTVDLNYIWLGIYVDTGWRRATYFYSTDSSTWNIAGEISTGLPISASNTGFGVAINRTVGATQINCSIDLLAHRYDIQRG